MKRTTLEVVGAVLAFVVWLHVHDAKVRSDQRAQVANDSLRAVSHVLDSTSTTALAAVKIAQRHEHEATQQVGRLEGALQATAGTVDTLRKLLRDSLSGSQQLALDSLEALHAAREANLTAQRDTFAALFREAAAGRDSLARLVRALEAQTVGLQAALVQARRKPLWESTPVKVTEAALALYGLARVIHP